MLFYPNVSPQVFALVLDQLRREGSSVEGASGMTPISAYYTITGHHWPLGDIRANMSYDGATVSVDVVQPKAWETAIGGKIQDAINGAVATIQRAGRNQSA